MIGQSTENILYFKNYFKITLNKMIYKMMFLSLSQDSGRDTIYEPCDKLKLM